MKANGKIIALQGFTVLLLFSCSGYLADGIRVVRGNYLFGQGRYQEALLHYLATSPDGYGEKVQNLIDYDVGLVYNALGETKAAIDKWNAVLESSTTRADKNLYFSLLYNIALLHMQSRDYERARLRLVEALGERPDDLPSRIALKRCLEKLRQQEQVADRESEQDRAETPVSFSFSTEQILNYISQNSEYYYLQQSDSDHKEAAQNDW